MCLHRFAQRWPNTFDTLDCLPSRFCRYSPQLALAPQPDCLYLLRTASSLSDSVVNVRPFMKKNSTTMASADFCFPCASLLSDTGLRQRNRSPRVRRVTFFPYICCIYTIHFRMTLGFRSFFCLLAQVNDASYAVPVRQTGNLLTASFRPLLTMAALAVRLAVPVIEARRGLPPPSHFLAHFRLRVQSTSHGASRHAWRTNKNR